MKASNQDDPLRRLGKKALRRLARQYKIKHFYRKSPASLRRAIRRAQLREQQAAGIKPLTPEELAIQRRDAEVKAFEEHRLRYLFLPSKFVHKGTHEEYLIEKDEDIELPDYYQENELTAMPIDPLDFMSTGILMKKRSMTCAAGWLKTTSFNCESTTSRH